MTAPWMPVKAFVSYVKLFTPSYETVFPDEGLCGFQEPVLGATYNAVADSICRASNRSMRGVNRVDIPAAPQPA